MSSVLSSPQKARCSWVGNLAWFPLASPSRTEVVCSASQAAASCSPLGRRLPVHCAHFSSLVLLGRDLWNVRVGDSKLLLKFPEHGVVAEVEEHGLFSEHMLERVSYFSAVW